MLQLVVFSMFYGAISEIENWNTDKMKEMRFIQPGTYVMVTKDQYRLSFIIRLVKALKDNDDQTVCASSLTYGEEEESSVDKSTKHFAGVKLECDQADKAIQGVVKGLKRRSKQVVGNPAKDIHRCKSRMFEKLEHFGTIRNEAGLRYALGDPIVAMFCNSFGYRLDLEYKFDESQRVTNVSKDSKADYICWVLCKGKVNESFSAAETGEVSVVIIETKHKKDIKEGIGQTLGYYIKR